MLYQFKMLLNTIFPYILNRCFKILFNSSVDLISLADFHLHVQQRTRFVKILENCFIADSKKWSVQVKLHNVAKYHSVTDTVPDSQWMDAITRTQNV